MFALAEILSGRLHLERSTSALIETFVDSLAGARTNLTITVTHTSAIYSCERCLWSLAHAPRVVAWKFHWRLIFIRVMYVFSGFMIYFFRSPTTQKRLKLKTALYSHVEWNLKKIYGAKSQFDALFHQSRICTTERGVPPLITSELIFINFKITSQLQIPCFRHRSLSPENVAPDCNGNRCKSYKTPRLHQTM